MGPPWGMPGWARKGMRWRVSVTILLGAAWLVFILLFAAFWSIPYTFFQNLVIVFVSLVILLAGIAALWASWGMRFAGGWNQWR